MGYSLTSSLSPIPPAYLSICRDPHTPKRERTSLHSDDHAASNSPSSPSVAGQRTSIYRELGVGAKPSASTPEPTSKASPSLTPSAKHRAGDSSVPTSTRVGGAIGASTASAPVGSPHGERISGTPAPVTSSPSALRLNAAASGGSRIVWQKRPPDAQPSGTSTSSESPVRAPVTGAVHVSTVTPTHRPAAVVTATQEAKPDSLASPSPSLPQSTHAGASSTTPVAVAASSRVPGATGSVASLARQFIADSSSPAASPRHTPHTTHTKTELSSEPAPPSSPSLTSSSAHTPHHQHHHGRAGVCAQQPSQRVSRAHTVGDPVSHADAPQHGRTGSGGALQSSVSAPHHTTANATSAAFSPRLAATATSAGSSRPSSSGSATVTPRSPALASSVSWQFGGNTTQSASPQVSLVCYSFSTHTQCSAFRPVVVLCAGRAQSQQYPSCMPNRSHPWRSQATT